MPWWLMAIGCFLAGWLLGWCMGIARTTTIYRALLREGANPHAWGLALLLLLPTLLWAQSVTMAWDYTDAPAAPAVGFVVYRDEGCTGVFVAQGEVARSTLQWTDAGPLQASLRYCYYVTAVSATEEESVPSNTLIFHVPPPASAPQAPDNLRALSGLKGDR